MHSSATIQNIISKSTSSLMRLSHIYNTNFAYDTLIRVMALPIAHRLRRSTSVIPGCSHRMAQMTRYSMTTGASTRRHSLANWRDRMLPRWHSAYHGSDVITHCLSVVRRQLVDRLLFQFPEAPTYEDDASLP